MLIRRQITIFLVLCLVGIVSTSDSVNADTNTAKHNTKAIDARYESLKSRYMRLRNTDREVARVKEWQEVINALENFALTYVKSRHAGVALSQAASLYLVMYEVLRKKEYLEESINKYRLVVTRLPQSLEADDALVQLAEMHTKHFNDKAAARRYLQKVLDDYPDGDMYEVAMIKLAALDSKSSRPSAAADAGDYDKKLAQEIVIIDPGHGGEDFGAVGVGGLYEKDVVLDISKRVQSILVADYSIAVLLTREVDEFVPLYMRTEFANDNNAILFISVHANASERSNLTGLEVYYLDGTADRAGSKLAERENASLQFEGAEADLRYILSDLMKNTKVKESIDLGKTISANIISHMKNRGHTIRNLGVKKAPFYVLVGANMPAVLVELGFIDHSEEGQKLADRQYRAMLSEALAKGIADYIKK